VNKESRHLQIWIRRLTLTLGIWGLSAPWMALALGTWIPLVNQAPSTISEIYLLSDGSVMALDKRNGAVNSYRLVPDIHGNYINGTWSQLASMHDGRDGFATQILTDGRVFCVGGEHGGGECSAETYDPLLNAWTLCPSTGAAYSDACSEILPNGNVLVSPVGPTNYGGTLIYNPTQNDWVAGPNLYRGYDETEGCWVKLPDNSILTVDFGTTNSERYIPSLNQWINDGNIPVNLWQGGAEIGAGLLLPNGNVFWLGQTNTALYTPSGTTNMGVWQAGPIIPNGQEAEIGPACMMPNGKALCMVHPSGTYGPPGSFYEYDPTANAFTQAALPGGNSNLYPNDAGMTVLPDGTILVSFNGFSATYCYQPDGSQLAAGKPTIISITNTAYRTYHLTGQMLNGLNEGPNYGGGNQENSCNYPLVRMSNSVSGNVYYARTYNWSSNGVMTGTNIVSTEFMVPANLPAGNYSLVVVADGISSTQVSFTFNPDPLSITLLNGFDSSGSIGGPFRPDDQAYFLNNTSASSLNWSLINTSVWLSVSSTSGTLVSGGQSTVIVSLNSTATNLPAGIYTASIWFTNMNTCAAQSIPFRLVVTPLIQNGGFETGSFADWNWIGNLGNSYAATALLNNGPAYSYSGSHSGYFFAFLGMNTISDYISQTVPTVPGQEYALSSFVDSPSGIGSANEFAISWDGVTLFDQQNFSTIGWTNLQFVVWATSDSTELEFSFENATNYFRLDDVVLSKLPPTLSIAAQPASQIIPAGANATLSVMAGGPPPFTYQWQKNGTNLLDDGDISGSATANLSVSDAIVADGGNYSVIVANDSQSVTSLLATLTVVGISPYCAVSAPEGLVSWWTGNYTANDLVGTNNGTLQNGISYAPGFGGYAFSFNGVDQFISIPDSPSWAFGTNEFTMELWANFSSTTEPQTLLACDEGWGNTRKWILWQGSALELFVDVVTNDYVIDSAAFLPTLGQWYHIAFTRSGSVFAFYFNGSLYSSIASPVVMPAPNAPLTIGNAEGNYNFNGLLDNVRIYNRALSAPEIQAIYLAGSNGMCAPTPLMFTGSPSYNKTNGFILNARLRSSQSYHIQANTNLASTNWITLTIFTAGSAPIFQYTNKPSNTLQQFYRIVSP